MNHQKIESFKLWLENETNDSLNLYNKTGSYNALIEFSVFEKVILKLDELEKENIKHE